MFEFIIKPIINKYYKIYFIIHLFYHSFMKFNLFLKF